MLNLTVSIKHRQILSLFTFEVALHNQIRTKQQWILQLITVCSKFHFKALAPAHTSAYFPLPSDHANREEPPKLLYQTAIVSVG